MEGKFLSDIVNILKEVQWLYDFPMTQVLTRDVLNYMPVEWKAAFSDIKLDVLNGIPQCIQKEEWPFSLRKFLQQCQELSLHKWIDDSQHGIEVKESLISSLPKKFYKGMSDKKRHEVECIVRCIKHLSEITNCSCVLDIGSGMGYVDSAVHQLLQLNVFGVEGNETLVKNAQARRTELSGMCKGIAHINWVVRDNQLNLEIAKELVHHWIKSSSVCSCDCSHQRTESNVCDKDHSCSIEMEGRDCNEVSVNENAEQNAERCRTSDSKSAMLIGIHSCADLSPVIIKIFQHCPELSSLVLFSCCYHKLKSAEEEEKILSQFVGSYTSASQHSEYMCESGKGEISHGGKSETCEECNNCCSSVNTATSGTTEPEKKQQKDNIKRKVRFSNFPMSNTLKEIMKEKDFQLSNFGLRLAAQESGTVWQQHTQEDHKIHEKHVVYRALLEAFCLKEGYTLKKRRRRCARKSKFCNFDEYVKTVIENYDFLPATNVETSSENISSTGVSIEAEKAVDSSSGEQKKFSVVCSKTLDKGNTLSPGYIQDGLNECYDRYEHLFPLIEPLTGLQLALQPVIEALVLVDRLVYLKENHFDKVWLEKVFDVTLSPRNVALIAIR